MSVHIRDAIPGDLDAIRSLLPRLAAFDIPPWRQPEQLWKGDEKTLRGWADGSNTRCLVHVAEDSAGRIVGATMVSLRDEMLSGEPSAHLEVLAVAEGAERRGIGSGLLARAEQAAKERGAQSMTLHVFARNQRARALYDRAGYDGELMRYFKPLD